MFRAAGVRKTDAVPEQTADRRAPAASGSGWSVRLPDRPRPPRIQGDCPPIFHADPSAPVSALPDRPRRRAVRWPGIRPRPSPAQNRETRAGCRRGFLLFWRARFPGREDRPHARSGPGAERARRSVRRPAAWEPPRNQKEPAWPSPEKKKRSPWRAEIKQVTVFQNPDTASPVPS